LAAFSDAAKMQCLRPILIDRSIAAVHQSTPRSYFFVWLRAPNKDDQAQSDLI
jgi:hypothetical protein